jgi:hypothetical protein
MRFDKLTQNSREALDFARPLKSTLKRTITNEIANWHFNQLYVGKDPFLVLDNK